MRYAIFLDRDGTINVEKEYLHRVEDWEWIPGAIDAIRMINQMGYLAIVVTNQAGVARGYYSELDIRELHDKVDVMLSQYDAKIDAYYYCPHHSDYGTERNCNCRKPEPGMLLKAKKDFGIDLQKSYMIGDKDLDVIAAIRARVTPILVTTGYGSCYKDKVEANVVVDNDILSAVKRIRTLKGGNEKK